MQEQMPTERVWAFWFWTSDESVTPSKQVFSGKMVSEASEKFGAWAKKNIPAGKNVWYEIYPQSNLSGNFST